MRNDRPKTETVGFGFEPEGGAYHFVVTVPTSSEELVTVAEHFAYGENVEEAAERARFSDEPQDFTVKHPRLKVEIRYSHWAAVADDVRAEFNRRLLGSGQKKSAWKPGENRLASYLGKELVLLLWAIEGAQLADVPNAFANWQGLAPEERWWLYTTINASTGHVSEGRDRGWRKAIQIAFTENTVGPPAYFERSAPSSGQNGHSSAAKNGRNRKKTDAKAEGQPILLGFSDDMHENNTEPQNEEKTEA